MLPDPSKGYLVRRLVDAPTVPCPCGESTRPLAAADGAPCSLHVTAIRDAARHYHRQTTEVYYILEGSGKMELDREWVDLEPGTVGKGFQRTVVVSNEKGRNLLQPQCERVRIILSRLR